MQGGKAKSFKLLVLGDGGVGKTSLAMKFITGMFTNRYTPTYHGQHYHKHLETPDGEVYIQVWDTSGSNRFRSVSSHFLQDTDGAVLLYDVTSQPTFSSVQEYWLTWVRSMVPDHFRVILVGNKVDRVSSRQVQRETARTFCREQGLDFYETSAKSGQNVETAFLEAVNLLGDKWDVSGDFGDTVQSWKEQPTNTKCTVL